MGIQMVDRYTSVLIVFYYSFLFLCRHESRVKHVVIETKPDPVTGILYHITPNGPFCSSLCELIEEARKTSIIQNHLFDVVLTKSPPKVSIQKVSEITLSCKRFGRRGYLVSFPVTNSLT